jgi:hypothetical protein
MARKLSTLFLLKKLGCITALATGAVTTMAVGQVHRNTNHLVRPLGTLYALLRVHMPRKLSTLFLLKKLVCITALATGAVTIVIKGGNW